MACLTSICLRPFSAATATQLVRMDDPNLVDAGGRAHTRGRPGRSHVCASDGVW